jgi:Bifunctional DNA primase/polymerase, N-terminal
MSRLRWELRDAAVGYAARGIPVLPLHYPLPHRSGLQPVTDDQLPAVERASCSCRDRDCGQVGKHPLGSLVPHGVKDATTNRARVLAWWTRHPQANIGLATGHRFDVLDIDGPTGAQAIQTLATEHGLNSTGPLVRTGGGGWHYYLAPTGLGNVRPTGLSMSTGAVGAAMWSPHPAATPPATPTSGSPAATSTPRWPRSRHRCEPG